MSLYQVVLSFLGLVVWIKGSDAIASVLGVTPREFVGQGREKGIIYGQRMDNIELSRNYRHAKKC